MKRDNRTAVTRRYRFCASHRLHSLHLNDAENDKVYGKCNNPFGHGHDYVLDVSVSGQLDEETGLLLSIADLDRMVNIEILQAISHRNLNLDVSEFKTLVPTTENLALVIVDRLAAAWEQYFPYSRIRLSGISIQETDRNSFEIVVPQVDETRRFSETSDAVSNNLNESVTVNA